MTAITILPIARIAPLGNNPGLVQCRPHEMGVKAAAFGAKGNAMDGFVTEVTTTATADDLNHVQRQLRLFNEQFVGQSKARLAVFQRAPDERGIVGAAVGYLVGEEIFIDWLWVEQPLRGQGHGAHLLAAAERAAIAHGCKRVTLNTFSFQAPDFYRKQGYTMLAEIPDFMVGFTKIYFRKELVAVG